MFFRIVHPSFYIAKMDYFHVQMTCLILINSEGLFQLFFYADLIHEIDMTVFSAYPLDRRFSFLLVIHLLEIFLPDGQSYILRDSDVYLAPLL